MANSYDKIDAPMEDTVIFGGRTLKQIVDLMDRLKGVFEIVDVPSSTNRRQSILSRTTFHSTGPKSPQCSLQHLLCYHDLYFEGAKLRPHGWLAWDMYIAHHFRSYEKYGICGPRITTENLPKFVEEGKISFIIAPHCDASRDLDALEASMARWNQRLAMIGEWIRLDLCMLVECACGRRSKLNARDRFHMISESRTTLDVLRKMRCTACGASDVKSTAAYYRDGDTAFWNYSKASSFSHSRRSREPLDELYMNLGGDGENAAYVGDGLFVDPDGTLHD